MPSVRLNTNLPDEKIPVDFNAKFALFLADLLNRKVEHLTIMVCSQKRLTVGTSSDPVVTMIVMLKASSIHMILDQGRRIV